MKKFVFDKKKLIAVLLILILAIILIVLGIFVSKRDINSKEDNLIEQNFYDISSDKGELPGNITITNDAMKAAHCLNDICIEDVVVYNADSIGRVDYTIINNSNNVASGYLKMNFSTGSVIIAYSSLSVGKKEESTSQYNGFDINNTFDYTLEELNEADLEKIVIH